MVFMLGGVSFTELKTVREIMNNESREVVIGSTAFLSAKDFVDDLTLLAKDDD